MSCCFCPLFFSEEKLLSVTPPVLDIQISLFASSTTSRKITGVGHSSPEAQDTRDRMQLHSLDSMNFKVPSNTNYSIILALPAAGFTEPLSPSMHTSASSALLLLPDVCSVHTQELLNTAREQRHSHHLQLAKLGKGTRE